MTTSSLMILVWCVLVLSAVCSKEIPLGTAVLSSTEGQHSANKAVDNNMETSASTNKQENPWLRLNFKTPSDVDEVVIKKGYAPGKQCTFSVSVHDGQGWTPCGTYKRTTNMRYNETVHCTRGKTIIILDRKRFGNQELTIV